MSTSAAIFRKVDFPPFCPHRSVPNSRVDNVEDPKSSASFLLTLSSLPRRWNSIINTMLEDQPDAEHLGSRVWRNPTLQLAICRYASSASLARIARTSERSLRTAVRVLYHSLYYDQLEAVLAGVSKVCQTQHTLSWPFTVLSGLRMYNYRWLRNRTTT
jgi:hypothetical protein